MLRLRSIIMSQVIGQMQSTQAAELVVLGKHYLVVSYLVPCKTMTVKMHGSLSICKAGIPLGLRHGHTGIVRATVQITMVRYIKLIHGGNV